MLPKDIYKILFVIAFLGILINLCPIVSGNGASVGYPYSPFEMTFDLIPALFPIVGLFLLNLITNLGFIELFNRLFKRIEDISNLLKYTTINFLLEGILIIPAILITAIFGSTMEYTFIPHGIMSFFVIYFNFIYCFGKHHRNAIAMGIVTNPGLWWLIIGMVI